MARKVFGFSREWAAPLASGISICGVSAAIATGAAIRARPVVPIMVSSLVVVFSVVELLVLPFLAHAIIPDEPMVAAAWMGLAVKTDGAAIASGAITEALYMAQGGFQKGWMLMTTTTVKIFIDLFIGVWCFILACVWVYGIDRKPGEKVSFKEVWDRFPKFVIGYFIAFALFITHDVKYDVDSSDSFDRDDSSGHVCGDRFTQRTSSDREVNGDFGDAVVADLNGLDHAQVGDGLADLGVFNAG